MHTHRDALRDEIKQTRPFRSVGEEIVASIKRTAAVINRHQSQVVEPFGITIQQYNVLRILRGAGKAGLPTLAIRDRMVEEAAGITRLLDKLERSGYVVRQRSVPDRRQVLCHITPKGSELVAAVDVPIDVCNQRAESMLGDLEKEQLVELLGAVRSAYATRGQRIADSDVQRSSPRIGQPPR
jgi:DNA-binding MarR family transcriptional regulator